MGSGFLQKEAGGGGADRSSGPGARKTPLFQVEGGHEGTAGGGQQTSTAYTAHRRNRPFNVAVVTGSHISFKWREGRACECDVHVLPGAEQTQGGGGAEVKPRLQQNMATHTSPDGGRRCVRAGVSCERRLSRALVHIFTHRSVHSIKTLFLHLKVHNKTNQRAPEKNRSQHLTPFWQTGPRRTSVSETARLFCS